MLVHQEFNDYLKEGNFNEFMQAWKLQFEKLGTLGGVAIIKLNDENRLDIENFIGVNTKKNQHLKLSWRKFKQILLKTRYAEVDFVKVLELYFDTELITKKTQQERNHERTEKFFEKLLEENLSVLARQWIEDVLQTKSSVYQDVLKNKDKENQKYKDILIITKALDHLPSSDKQQKSLAVFASQMTGNPHAFDQGTSLHFLLTQALIYTSSIMDSTHDHKEPVDYLMRFGLFKEDINNYCSIYGLSAIKDGILHAGWDGFYQHKEAWNVNLNNVLNVDTIVAKEITGIYIVENPSIFEALVDEVTKLSKPYALICSNGQPTQVVYALLDKIEMLDIPMFYAGDFDPEGLLIAQRLLDRYETLDLWLYNEDDYRGQFANKKATDRRIKMLSQLSDSRLILIGENIREFGVGYQENMLNSYIQAIRKW